MSSGIYEFTQAKIKNSSGIIKFSFWTMNFMDEALWTQSYLLYHYIPWLIRAFMPLRHRPSGVPPSGSIPSERACARPSTAA